MANKFLKKEKLDALVKAVAVGGGRFIAPTVEARRVVYAPVADAGAISTGHVIPVNSYKDCVFPQTEVIAEYRIRKDGLEMNGKALEPVDTVVFGARPCEAASLKSLRSVFTWDFIDEFYTRREEKLVVMTVACTKADDECFCTTVSLSPETTAGSDVYMKETEDGDYLAAPTTERGEAFMARHAAFFVDAAAGVKTRALAMPEKIPGVDLARVKKRLDDTSNYSESVWAELSRKCIGCGACTFSCPTCHCFDIVDEGTAFEGERRKNWDACQFDTFTLHASGHNPRDTQYKRWRNRFMCKFKFYPDKFSSIGCVGCGRCIRVCPVRHDITEAMQELSR